MGSTMVQAKKQEPWQVTLYKRSLKKRQTVTAALRYLPDVRGKTCLEIGCATGITSYFLRQRGGDWTSVDFEQDHIDSTLALVGENAQLIGNDGLPFANEYFDVVAGINFLEHIQDDDRFISDIARVLKPGGTLVFVAPTLAGQSGLIRLAKRAYGLTADIGGFGHARDGYAPLSMVCKFAKVGLETENLDTYSRFFSEFIEISLNFLFHKQVSGKKETGGPEATADFHGVTSPTSQESFKKVSLPFRIYSAAFPAIKAVTLLDRLIPRSQGYMLVMRARKVD